MRHRLPAALVLALLVLGVAGCSDDPEPDVAAPTTSSPSTTTSTPVSAPPSTTTTPGPRPESAEAFIRNWLTASDQMQIAGDTAQYRALGPDCKPCTLAADTVEKYFDAGGYIRFDGTKVLRVKGAGKAGSIFDFDVALDTASTEFKTSSSGPVQTIPGGRNSLRVRMKRAGTSWLVVDYSILAS